MLCSKCGAEIIGDQTFCTSCGAKTARSGGTYELFLTESTTSKRALNLTTEITGKNLEQARQLLSRPRSIILAGLTLNKAAEYKSKYLRLGVESDFRRSADPHKIRHNHNSNASSESISEDSVFNEPSPPIENSINSQPEPKPVRKIWRVEENERPERDISKLKSSADNGSLDLLRLILLILGVLLLLLTVFSTIFYFKKAPQIETLPAKTDKQAHGLRNKSEVQARVTETLNQGMPQVATPAENNHLLSKGTAYTPPAAEDEKSAENTIKKRLNDQTDLNRDELNQELEKITSPELQDELLESIQKTKKKIGNLKKILNQDDQADISGDVEMIGTRFSGTIDLPDQTKIDVSIHTPDNQIITERQTVVNSGFTTNELDSVQLGNYRVSVKISDLADQIEELQSKLAAVIKKLEETQDGLVIDKIVTNKEFLNKNSTLSAPEVRAAVTNLLSQYFGPVQSENQILVDEENILIKGTASDSRQFILQAAAGIGFASRQSNWQVNNLVIIVNNRKYKIAVQNCRKAMELVNNDYKNPLFAETIVKALQ